LDLITVETIIQLLRALGLIACLKCPNSARIHFATFYQKEMALLISTATETQIGDNT